MKSNGIAAPTTNAVARRAVTSSRPPPVRRIPDGKIEFPRTRLHVARNIKVAFFLVDGIIIIVRPSG